MSETIKQEHSQEEPCTLCEGRGFVRADNTPTYDENEEGIKDCSCECHSR